MARILLIHGSCHGAWCWRDLIPALEHLGHAPTAIDLPGNGDDTTPLADVTLEATRDAVLAASTPDSIILGHSWGGFPISAAAAADPDAMRALIYLSAYVPVSGKSMVDMRKASPRQTILDAVVRSPDGLSYSVRPEHAGDLFYHDCPEETVAFALAHLGPQAIRPQDTPLDLGDRFETVPKFFIRGTEDRTIPPEYQEQMTRGWPGHHVMTMPTSHSSFFADPSGLAARIDRITGML